MNNSLHQSVIDLSFPITGRLLPSDHSYKLFGSISRLIPETHEASWLGIHSIKGRIFAPGVIRLDANSCLRLRLPCERVPWVYRLAGATLKVGNFPIRCGIPQLFPLRPSNILRSRLVVIKVKGFEHTTADPDSFCAAVSRQLEVMGVSADVNLERVDGADSYARRIVRVGGSVIPGFGVILRNLTDEDSLRVQAQGLGGRRRMGCGLFVPVTQLEPHQVQLGHSLVAAANVDE